MSKKMLAVLIGAIIATAANAECIMRTSSVTKVVGKIEDIADIRPLVSPTASNERQCSIRARVQYKDDWHTIYADYTGPAEVGDQELCLNAVELGVRQFLASKEAKLMHSEQQMVCSDEPVTKIRPVQKFEVVRISEVRPHPNKPVPFLVKGVECRYFIEPGTNSKVWEGVVCRTGRKDAEEWLVVDKF